MTETPAARQLASLRAECAAVRAAFVALDGRVSDADWARRPSPAEWSIAECIAHLVLTSAAMVPRLRAAIAGAPTFAPSEARAYRGTLVGRLLTSMVGPVRIVAGLKLGRVPTTPPFVPGSADVRATLRVEFLRSLEEEQLLVQEAEGRAIDKVRIESPFRAGMFYDCYSGLLILPRHEMRHLVQAQRALEALQR